MKKIFHIHTDSKFLHDSDKYVSQSFENKIIFVGDKEDVKKDYGDSILFFPRQDRSISLIIEAVKDADLIILNELDTFKTKLLEQLPPDKKIFLRLFGYELYYLKRDGFISNETRKSFFPIRKEQSIIRNFKNLIHQYFQKPMKFDTEKQRNIFRKIDRILLVNKFEYDGLGKYFYLPEFLKIPILNEHRHLNLDTPKKNLILIGNSKHYWNNHIDILKMLRRVNSISNYQLFLFFNYGPEGDYTQKVRKLSKSFDYLTFQEEFLSMPDFIKAYSEASALVINSYRQHALGNIFTAIFSGCKIYLNKRSSTYNWMKANNFIISEVSELKDDIKRGNIGLSKNEMEHNVKIYRKLTEEYSQKDFIKAVESILDND